MKTQTLAEDDVEDVAGGTTNGLNTGAGTVEAEATAELVDDADEVDVVDKPDDDVLRAGKKECEDAEVEEEEVEVEDDAEAVVNREGFSATLVSKVKTGKEEDDDEETVAVGAGVIVAEDGVGKLCHKNQNKRANKTISGMKRKYKHHAMSTHANPNSQTALILDSLNKKEN